MAALSASLNVTARTTAWTYDESHDDVRRMVISRSMVNKQASVHRDSRGMRYSQLPPYYGLCYAITYTNIYNLCKTIEVDRYGNQWLFDDECFTIYKWLERLEEATGISRNNGLYECKIRDGLVLIMLIACSDNLETVPRPAARIQAFKDFLHQEKALNYRGLAMPTGCYGRIQSHRLVLVLAFFTVANHANSLITVTTARFLELASVLVVAPEDLPALPADPSSDFLS
ncbi:hypothetical protein EV122DRAFT_282625 [Schizophyllum commune]